MSESPTQIVKTTMGKLREACDDASGLVTRLSDRIDDTALLTTQLADRIDDTALLVAQLLERLDFCEEVLRQIYYAAEDVTIAHARRLAAEALGLAT